jgi:hypothetical protein
MGNKYDKEDKSEDAKQNNLAERQRLPPTATTALRRGRQTRSAKDSSNRINAGSHGAIRIAGTNARHHHIVDHTSCQSVR